MTATGSATEAYGAVAAPAYDINARPGAIASVQLPICDGMFVDITGDPAGFRVLIETARVSEHVVDVTMKLSRDSAATLPKLNFVFGPPCIDTQCVWSMAAYRNKVLHQHFMRSFVSRTNTHGPLYCVHSQSGENRLTFAASDLINPLYLNSGADDMLAAVSCVVGIADEPQPVVKDYALTVRFDARPVSWMTAVRDGVAWWETLQPDKPLQVPAATREPLYSTWYSFHLDLEAGEFEKQCQLAADMGCKVVIVDDGWETPDRDGYGRAGDWLPSPNKFPDFAGTVKRVQAMGMKFMLWFATPFMGKRAACYDQWKSMLLPGHEDRPFGVIDPRFPQIRHYLAGCIERLVRDYHLDGIKIDFIDSIVPVPGVPDRTGDGRDTPSIAEGVERFCTEIITRVLAVKPDAMFEYRQAYIGPRMRRYTNMLRSSDCALGAIQNRIQVIDLRLTGRESAVHSDMFMWNPNEPVEAAALQIINVLFSVPQVSVLIDKVPADHQAMLRFWLKFWRDHRDALLDGDLLALHPESGYPVVIGSTAQERVIGVYDEAIVPLTGALPARVYLVNATAAGRIVLEVEKDAGRFEVVTRRTTGDEVSRTTLTLNAGLHRLSVPASGLVELHRR